MPRAFCLAVIACKSIISARLRSLASLLRGADPLLPLSVRLHLRAERRQDGWARGPSDKFAPLTGEDEDKSKGYIAAGAAIISHNCLRRLRDVDFAATKTIVIVQFVRGPFGADLRAPHERVGKLAAWDGGAAQLQFERANRLEFRHFDCAPFISLLCAALCLLGPWVSAALVFRLNKRRRRARGSRRRPAARPSTETLPSSQPWEAAKANFRARPEGTGGGGERSDARLAKNNGQLKLMIIKSK